MIALASLGAGVIGGAMSYFGRQEQARRMRAETDEMLRRKELEDAKRLGTARAQGAASGIEFGGSLQTYLDTMAAEMRRQSEWAYKTGMESADDVGRAGLAGAVADIGSSLFQYGAANNWWQQG